MDDGERKTKGCGGQSGITKVSRCSMHLKSNLWLKIADVFGCHPTPLHQDK